MKENPMQVNLTLESKGEVHMYSQGSIRLKVFYFIVLSGGYIWKLFLKDYR